MYDLEYFHKRFIKKKRFQGNSYAIIKRYKQEEKNLKKLKTRLIMAFVLLLLIPLLLISTAVFGFSKYQMYALGKTFGLEVTYDNLSDNVNLISNLTNVYVEKLTKQLKTDDDQLMDTRYLEEVNTELKTRYSALILRVDDRIVYSGLDDTLFNNCASILEELPKYKGFEDDEHNGVYLGGDVQVLLKQIDFTTDNQQKGSLFLVTSSTALVPHIKSMLFDLLLIAVVVLALTSMGMMYWIYNSIKVPLKQLKEATNNIKNGNLDFTVEGCAVEELNDLCEDFEDMRRRLKATTEEKLSFDQESKALISNISHDLKTPITAVKGYVEGIMDGVADTPEKMDRYIRTIYTKANDMDRLINELTFYSKIDTNRIPYTFSKVHVVDYFDDCVEELSMELEERGMELTYDNRVAPDVMIIADVEQLKRVINNIISNSIKYMDKEHGKIQIRLKDVGDFIQVEIEDNGKGIEAKNVPYIFERFYRTDASRNSAKGGSGIGLSIVKKILEDHGGKVWATSVEGEGTTICFVIRKYQEVER